MIFELVSAWLLGIFTQSLLNDSKAVISCRNDLLDLERVLEDWASMIFVAHRNSSYDSEKIKSVKSIIKSLELHHAGLFFKNHELADLINQSLVFILQFESNSDGPQNQSHTIGINLLELWGIEDLNNSQKATKVIYLRKFFYGGLLKRAWLYCWFFISKCWKKVQGFLCGCRNTSEN